VSAAFLEQTYCWIPAVDPVKLSLSHTHTHTGPVCAGICACGSTATYVISFMHEQTFALRKKTNQVKIPDLVQLSSPLLFFSFRLRKKNESTKRWHKGGGWIIPGSE